MGCFAAREHLCACTWLRSSAPTAEALNVKSWQVDPRAPRPTFYFSDGNCLSAQARAFFAARIRSGALLPQHSQTARAETARLACSARDAGNVDLK